MTRLNRVLLSAIALTASGFSAFASECDPAPSSWCGCERIRGENLSVAMVRYECKRGAKSPKRERLEVFHPPGMWEDCVEAIGEDERCD